MKDLDAPRDCRLYLITPPRFDVAAFSVSLKQALDAGDAACLQLRMKDIDDDMVCRAADILMPIAHAYDLAFIVNDRADLAAKIGADGVHIGQEDHDYVAARQMMGPQKIVGVTCHNSRHLAMEAAEAGADYVAFGAFYPTQTKTPKTKADPEILTWWQGMMTLPCVAIGGITTENCIPLIEAGADFLAVLSGIWDHSQGPAAAVKDFNRIIARTLGG